VKRAITAMALTATVLTGVVASTASAATPTARVATGRALALLPSAIDEGAYTITNKASRKCVDADTNGGGANGTRVQLWDCNSLNQQAWRFWRTSPGSMVFYIENLKYGKCLDMDLNTFPANGTRVQLWDCNHQAQQLWSLSDFNNYGMQLRWDPFYTAYSTSVMDADNSHGLGNGSRIQLWQNVFGDNQLWKIWPWG
jgi:hypothetical protein